MNWRTHTSRHRFVLSTVLKKQDCEVTSTGAIDTQNLLYNSVDWNETKYTTEFYPRVFVTQNKLENCKIIRDVNRSPKTVGSRGKIDLNWNFWEENFEMIRYSSQSCPPVLKLYSTAFDQTILFHLPTEIFGNSIRYFWFNVRKTLPVFFVICFTIYLTQVDFPSLLSVCVTNQAPGHEMSSRTKRFGDIPNIHILRPEEESFPRGVSRSFKTPLWILSTYLRTITSREHGDFVVLLLRKDCIWGRLNFFSKRLLYETCAAAMSWTIKYKTRLRFNWTIIKL